MATTTQTIHPGAVVIPVPKTRRLPAWVRALMRNPLSITGAIIVLVFVIIGILAPVLAPPRYPSQPYQIPRSGFSALPKLPYAQHESATTEGQYDIYYGVIWGTRT